jgi:hypothetical protein
VYQLVLVYLSRGFYLTLAPIYGNRPVGPSITPDLEIFDHVRFFAATTVGFDAFSSAYRDPWTSADLIPWKGFQEFDVYCAQARPARYNICGGGYQPEPS